MGSVLHKKLLYDFKTEYCYGLFGAFWTVVIVNLNKKWRLLKKIFSLAFRFVMAWGCVNDDIIFIYGWIIPLTGYVSSVHLQNRRHLDSIWSCAQIAPAAQPIGRCETDRLWPHRSSTDLNNSRLLFTLKERAVGVSGLVGVWLSSQASNRFSLSVPPTVSGGSAPETPQNAGHNLRKCRRVNTAVTGSFPLWDQWTMISAWGFGRGKQAGFFP